MKKLFVICCLLFTVCCYSNAIQITTIVNNPSNHDICLRVIDNNGNYTDLDVTSEETEKSFDYDFELGYKYNLIWKGEDGGTWRDFSTLPLKSVTAGNPGYGSNVPYSFEELSIKNTEESSTDNTEASVTLDKTNEELLDEESLDSEYEFSYKDREEKSQNSFNDSEPFYLGGWSFGLNENYFCCLNKQTIPNEFTKYFDASFNVFEFSSDYIGRFYPTNKFALTFLFGGNLGWFSPEKLICKEDFSIRNKNGDWIYFYKGTDYGPKMTTSHFFMGLQFGFGFDIICNDNITVGFNYKPLIWRNPVDVTDYPLFYEVMGFIEFGKLSKTEMSTCMLEIGWAGCYSGVKYDFDGGLKIGLKVNLLGDSKSMRNKSALIVNTALITLPFIVESVKNPTNNIPDTIKCEKHYGTYLVRDKLTSPKYIHGHLCYRYTDIFGCEEWYYFD